MSEVQAYGVVSSAEFILKSNGPKMEPSVTPYSIFNLLLKHSFILVLWVRLLK